MKRALTMFGVLLVVAGALLWFLAVMTRTKQFNYLQNQPSLPSFDMGFYYGKLRVAVASPDPSTQPMSPGTFMQYGGRGEIYSGGLLQVNRYRVRTASGPWGLSEYRLSLWGAAAILVSIGATTALVSWVTSRRHRAAGFPVNDAHPKSSHPPTSRPAAT